MTASRSSIATGRRVGGDRQGRDPAVPSRPRAWRPHGASGRRTGPCPTTPSTPGMRAAMAARPASAATAPSFAAPGARRRRFVDEIGSGRLCARATSRSSRKASAPCWPPPGCTTMRRRSARWCWPRRPSRSSSTCPSPGRALRCGRRCKGRFFVNSYVKAKFLTHDPERIASFDADPLITRPIAVNILLGLYDACRPRRRRCARHHGADAAADLRRRLGGAARAAARVLRQSRRARPRSGMCCPASSTTRSASAIARQALDLIRPFLERQFAAPEQPVDLLDADRAGYTRDEADRLASPLPPLVAARPLLGDEPRLDPHGRLAVGGHRARASPPASIPARRSTTSTATRPRGIGAARPHDRPHLSRLHRLARHPPAQAASRGADRRRPSATLQAAGRPVHIVDIAAGHGRYVLDAVAECAEPPASRSCCAITRDLNVAAGLQADRRAGTCRPASLASHKADAFDARNACRR